MLTTYLVTFQDDTCGGAFLCASNCHSDVKLVEDPWSAVIRLTDKILADSNQYSIPHSLRGLWGQHAGFHP